LLILLLSGLLCIFAWGCSSKPQLSKADIEAKIKGSIPLTQIHLTETEPGKYEGTGTGPDGRTWKIKASYTYAKKDGRYKSDLTWEAGDSKGEKKNGNEGWDGDQPPPTR
jgi:hypothetical protein